MEFASSDAGNPRHVTKGLKLKQKEETFPMNICQKSAAHIIKDFHYDLEQCKSVRI